MTTAVDNIDTLRIYFQGVLSRANHHARNVRGTALICGGFVLAEADPATIEVRTYAGEMANVLWCVINTTRYAFVYNHKTGKIEVRERTQQGRVVMEMSDDDPTHAIVDMLAML